MSMPQDNTSRAPRWKRLAMILAVGIAANAVTIHGELARGDRCVYLVGALPVLLALGIAAAYRRFGGKRLCFALVPALALLLLAEFAFRGYAAWAANPSQRAYLATPVCGSGSDGGLYSPHHYSLYTLTPGLDLPDGLRHNHLGLRDHRTLAPDPQAVRIVFIGGSTTYTIGIRDNAKIFTAGLEEKLNAEYADVLGGRRIEVVNAGMGGSTSAENLERLIFFVSEIDPDLVVIQHGLNDVWTRAVGEIETDFGNYRRRWSPPPVFGPKFSIAYGLTRRACEYSLFLNFAMLRLGLYEPYLLKDYTTHETRRLPGEEILTRNTARYFERNTRYMIAVSRAMGAEVMLATVPITSRVKRVREKGVPEHNAVLQQTAEREGVRFYDFAAEMPKDDAHLPDGRHVSQLGSNTKRDLYFAHFVKTGIVPALLEKKRREEENSPAE